ncbi:metal tolerance protein C2 [Canna indica]|uniref:Metal tolerance protein C2 n=1 Tax=Canna indica TaxID=4628 RepID=A0AAQ3KBE0_9LILI|nr:metal tolerance protein C2 [Canna indica]
MEEQRQPSPPRDLTPADTGLRFPPPRSSSFGHKIPDQRQWGGDYGLAADDRRFAFSRQASFRQHEPQRSLSFRANLSRSDSFISIPTSESDEHGKGFGRSATKRVGDGRKPSLLYWAVSVVRAISSGNRPMKRLAFMISLNVAYSTTELLIGIFTGRVGLVSDAFHLTFGCGLLTFSLFAMAASRKKPDEVYTYGYKRLEVLSAFTNALFLLFMSFSLAVEALHAFMQDESEHKHYLVISAVTNLLVNLLGVWFFRNYARVSIVYRKAEDMNYHSVCLHVLADSIRSAGLILASWFLSLGVEIAEVLCLGLVSIAVFMLVMPLFKATGSILLQTSPASIPSSALNKCRRQIISLDDVSEVSDARFWELVPGHAIGSLSIQVKRGAEDLPIMHHVHGLYHELGVQDLTIQIGYS